jgi:hypothetical protein
MQNKSFYVIASNSVILIKACWLVVAQRSGQALKSEHTFGLSAVPNSLQRFNSLSCTQRTPAGFPLSIPGMAEEILGAIQQAPQPSRHSMS